MKKKHSWFGGLTIWGKGRHSQAKEGVGTVLECGGLQTRGVLTAQGHSVCGGTQSGGGTHSQYVGLLVQVEALAGRGGCSRPGVLTLKVRVELCWITGSHLVMLDYWVRHPRCDLVMD